MKHLFGMHSMSETRIKNIFLVFCSIFCFSVFCAPTAFATEYSASITTSGEVNLIGQPGVSTIEHSDVTVITNCKAGYNLTLATSVENNNFYLNGESINNEAGTFISPSNGTSMLSESPSTWGYLLSPVAPNSDNVFLPVSSNLLSPTVLKTSQETHRETDIEDSFSIYYGANIGVNLVSGSYNMVAEESDPTTYGGLVYYLTTDLSCTKTLDVTYNKNLDGKGGQVIVPGDVVSHFPSSSDNTLSPNGSSLILSSKQPTRPGYAFMGWNTSANGSGTSYHPGDIIRIGDDAANGELEGNVTLYAIWQIGATFVFHGNGLYFDEDDVVTTNTVTYANVCATRYGYVGEEYEEFMSSNISEGGVQEDPYNAESNLRVVTIDGASRLKVVIKYGIDADNGEVVVADGNWNGDFASLDKHYEKSSLDGAIAGTDTYIVDGNTATLYMDLNTGSMITPIPDDPVVTNILPSYDYGVYIQVYPIYDDARDNTTYESYEYCGWQSVNGEYELPEMGYHTFIEWRGLCPSDDGGGGIITMGMSTRATSTISCVFHNEEEIIAALDSDTDGLYVGNTVDLLAIYESPITIVFNGNGLYFDQNETEETNTVVYANTCATQYGYVGNTPVISKTPNIGNDGTQNGGNEPMDAYDPITIPGASKLKIVISYDNTTDGNTGIFYINEAVNEWSDGGWIELSGSGNDKVIVINGNAVTFNTYIYNTNGSNDYGYYARIYPVYEEERENTTYESIGEYCGWQIIDGEYKLPILGNIDFAVWHLNEGDQYFNNEANILAALTGGLGSSYSGQTIHMDAVYNNAITFTFNGNGLYFDQAGTKKTNTVIYGSVCTEDNGEETCSWQAIKGEYKLPVLSGIEFVNWYSDYVDFYFTDESEIISWLEDNGSDFIGRNIVLDANYDATTIVFSGNGLYFDQAGTEDTNIVLYNNVCAPYSGYVGNTYEEVMSSNIETGGAQNGSYTSSEDILQTINIPGADKLKVVVDYGITANTMGIMIVDGVWDGDWNNQPNTISDIYDANNNISGTETYVINGNTTTIYINSWNSPEAGSDYGAYIRVYPVYDEAHENTTYEAVGNICGWQAVGGTYKTPVMPAYTTFNYWQDAISHPAFANESEIINMLAAPHSSPIYLNATYSSPVTFVFDSNGLYFDEDGTVSANTVTYANICTTQYGYVGEEYEEVMSSNISEGGTQEGSYGTEINLQTVSINGADKLKVVVKYGLDTDNGGVIIAEGNWDGNFSNLSGRYYDKNSYNGAISGIDTYIINGDTATIFESLGAGSIITPIPDDPIVVSTTETTLPSYDYGVYIQVYPIYDEAHEGATYESYEYCGWQAVEGEYTLPDLGYNAFIEWRGTCPTTDMGEIGGGGGISLTALTKLNGVNESDCSFPNEAAIINALNNDVAGLYTGQTIYLFASYMAPVTFVFDGNGLYFDEDGTVSTNSVTYSNVCTTQYGYVGEDYEEFMSSNISEGGIQEGSYGTESNLQTISINGANKLKVVVDYGIDAYGGGVTIAAGSWGENSIPANAYVVTADFGAISGTNTYIIAGDTVTISENLNGESSGGGGIVTYTLQSAPSSYDYGVYVRVYPIYDEAQENTTHESYEYCGWQAVGGQYKPLYTIDGETVFGHWNSDYISDIDATLQYDNEQEIIESLNQGLGFMLAGQTIDLTAEWDYQVTVTMDANISSVVFTDPNGNTQTAIPLHPTILLKRGVEYTITANPVLGYEIVGWNTTGNGAFGSTTDNPTTYMTLGADTITVTSQEIPIYQVTVSMDSHSNSVSFANASYGIQTIVNQNNNNDGTHTGVVNLRRGVRYTITGTFDTANYYIFNNWSITGDGTISDVASGATTLTITGPATLNLTSKQRTGTATLDTGVNINSKMKTLAEGVEANEYTDSEKIKSVQMSPYLPENFIPTAANTVSVSESEKPIYIFFDDTNNDGIMYFYTEARYIYMNEDSSYLFNDIHSLTNISALADWNTGNVTNMGDMFYYASNLTDISALANWNTSSVTNMSGMFNSNYGLTDISALANWNTGSVTDMSYMFSSASSLTNISALSGWNTGSVTNMSYMFSSASSLTDISALANWNTSSVTDMRSMFSDTDIADGSTISNWDIRAVTATNGSTAYNSNKFYHMFYKSDNSYPIYPNFTKRIGTWNTSSNTNGTFVPASVTARTVTVNLDEHVRSVKFYDSTYGTRTITKDGDFIVLNRGTQYTITATYDAGYIIDSWSSTAGIVGSSTASPTTYRTYSDDTLSIISTVASTSTVTVNMDSHVSSVSFSNQGYDTETVTANNGTVTLVNNLTYYVVINYESGHMNSSLATTANGTIGNATTNGISYTIVGDDTISITSQQKTGTAALVTGSVLYSAINNKVKAIRMAGFLPTNFSPSSSNTISVSDSEKPVYIFFDTTNDANILYIYTEARDIYMNENSDNAFSGKGYLTDISALAEFNTSNVTSMVRMFSGDYNLTNVSALANWNTGSVTNMSYMFSYASYLTDISGLSNWNTGSVTNMDSMFSRDSRLANLSALSNWNTGNVTSMSYMFWRDGSLTDISGLSNWNTSSVENMGDMFSYTAITNTNALTNWNTGSVTDMGSMFSDNYSLTDISGLSNWNTGSVENMGYMFGSTGIANTNALANWNTGNVIYMSGMFAYINNLTDISGLSNWNTSSVTSMSSMFWNASSLANISTLANWDTSSVTDMSGMFFGTDITDGSAISGWDVRAVTAANGDATSSNRFYQMFHIYYHDTVIYPNFTKRLGTWNDEGTFIPSSTTTRIVTVNLDEHVNSVSFYNSDYGTKTIAKDGDFIALASGATYTITATVDDGYAFDGWYATYGSLRNPTANPTTYSTTTDSYIAAYSRTTTNSYQPAQHSAEPSNSDPVLVQSASTVTDNTISSSVPNNLSNGYAAPQGVSNITNSDNTDLSSALILASAVGAAASGALAIFANRRKMDSDRDED